MAEDWALLEVSSDVHMTGLPRGVEVEFDPNRRIMPGEEVFLIGYWDQGTAAQPGDKNQPSIIRSHVVNPPFLMNIPQGVICLHTPYDRLLRGMSGGAAVLWVPEERRIVVIGLYRGMRCQQFFRFTISRAHTVIRLPQEIFRR
jgi:hypothetical protein